MSPVKGQPRGCISASVTVTFYQYEDETLKYLPTRESVRILIDALKALTLSDLRSTVPRTISLLTENRTPSEDGCAIPSIVPLLPPGVAFHERLR